MMESYAVAFISFHDNENKITIVEGDSPRFAQMRVLIRYCGDENMEVAYLKELEKMPDENFKNAVFDMDCAISDAVLIK